MDHHFFWNTGFWGSGLDARPASVHQPIRLLLVLRLLRLSPRPFARVLATAPIPSLGGRLLRADVGSRTPRGVHLTGRRDPPPGSARPLTGGGRRIRPVHRYPALRYRFADQLDFGFVGHWLLQSPVHHRLHHVLDMSRATGHFGLCPLWDRLFGTWREEFAGSVDQSLAVGVATPYRHDAWLVADMWRDYADFWKGVWRLGAVAPSQTAGE